MKQYRIRAASAAELVGDVAAAVASGALTPGERLPSVRQLASQVGLSPVTVAAGLAELRRRGVVVSEPRRGSRIGSGPPLGSLRSPLPVPAGARDLSRGNPDPALLPALGGVLARAAGEAPRLYGEPAVVQELAVAARAQLRADGIPAAEVCVVSGALDGIERVLGALLRPGDRVAVENPGYAAMFDLLRALGLVLEPVALDDRGMDAHELEKALERGAQAVVITPRGQNPTGAAVDAQRAAELSAVLAAHPQVLAIEDDHLGEVAGAPLCSVLGGRERWAATRSVAKALGPDLRLAVVAADAATLARVQGRQQCGPGWVSHILQRTVCELWRDDEVAALVLGARDRYAERRELLLGELGRRGVRARGTSGLNVWIEVGDEAGVVAAMLARGWVLTPGAPYRLPGSAPAVRVTIATLTQDEAGRLADDLAETLAPAGWARTG